MKKILFLIGFVFVGCLVIGQNKSWIPDMERFKELDRKSPPGDGVIVFTGSSSIRVWPDLENLFKGKKVLNRGFGGSQYSDLIDYLDDIIGDYTPTQIVLYSGDNDVANKSAEVIYGDFCVLYGMIVDRFPDIRVSVISVKPSPSRWDKAIEMIKVNAMIQEYSRYRNNLDYVDMYSRMIGADGRPYPHIFVQDSLHMNQAGYDIWNEVMSPRLVGK